MKPSNKPEPSCEASNSIFKQLKRDRSECGVGVVMDLNGEKSHQLIEDALQILRNLDHRGARGAEENTGDGAGILCQKPHQFFTSHINGLPEFDDYGVGQFFLPKDAEPCENVRKIIESVVAEENFEIISWREVPTENKDLGKTALESEPAVRQLFLKHTGGKTGKELDTRLYVLMRTIENKVAQLQPEGYKTFYICSLDRKKIVYKGLLTNFQLGTYYPDLHEPEVVSSLALVHSRFSTNTLGSWKLAHPYRNIVHNGEINTYRGNVNWMRAREADLQHPLFGDEIDKIKPVTSAGQSDTAVFDNVLELIVESGRSLAHALRMLIPEAWNKDPMISKQKRDWYDYHSTMVEPWDGPALLAFTDGYSVGAVLDRNGFRPCRFTITRQNRLVMASETGVLDIDPTQVKEKGRLKPGQMFLADTQEGRILSDAEVFERLTDHQYGTWLQENRVSLASILEKTPKPDPKSRPEDLTPLQCVHGFTLEYLNRFLQPMSEDGKDPVGAMGDDAPPSILSSRVKPLFTYFKQHFAQVSNPPIDYIREDLVTSLESHIGRQGNFLDETPDHCRRLYLPSPILRDEELSAIEKMNEKGIKATTLDITFDPSKSLYQAVEDLRWQAVEATQKGFEILILSDRAAGKSRIPIPSLLAVSGLHHHLIRQGLRIRTSLVLESAQPCAVHHFSTLIGYGTDAINPWLALESLRDSTDKNTPPAREAIENYLHALEDGILKVMSKMGISTLESYKGAQIFESLGLAEDFIEEYFAGTASRVGGIGIAEVEEDVRNLHHKAYGPRQDNNLVLDQGGDLYWRRDGEYHWWNPMTVGTLQNAVRGGGSAAYKRFADLCNEQESQFHTFRGLMNFKQGGNQPISIEEVEPVESIFQRFFTSSMSWGALSQEAHETLAIAMNRIGAKASSGEGGEQPERFGTERECKNKQVASGRFGVTAHYLANAQQIEIKMAQGAKPGEGGQLPGGKVDENIARVRFTTPGVGLISPPPHHDIYSIEDLAQLIHDLKCANPDAEIQVKLVSEAGVGTIAAGVSKARADAILIAGDSGGTGAAAKTSIKSCGLPWELGLSEAHQLLLQTRLRSRVRLRVDGGLRTGRDCIVAAMLGAEEFGFGTSALITVGCIMLRKCHCNTCSVGVATQDPELRKKFPGKPEHVINYMHFIAEEMREIMASLGVRSVNELTGRVDLLQKKEVSHPRAKMVDLSGILSHPESEDAPSKQREQNHKLDTKIDHEIIRKAAPALERAEPVKINSTITNHDRTFGTLLSSAVVKKYGQDGLPDNTIQIDLKGSAGQSFGAFLANGISIALEGEVNDYVGKGLSGGKIAVRTPVNAAFRASNNIIIGNVALYGATGGELYVNGIGGERFAVRNSGAKAVVEGVGNHGCEYMTGGVVVILGNFGRNFGAGMSGGEAFVLHIGDDFDTSLNDAMVHKQPVSDSRDIQLLRRMIENHATLTGSEKAREILDSWDEFLPQFTKIMPNSYADVIEKHLNAGHDIRTEPPPPAGSWGFETSSKETKA